MASFPGMLVLFVTIPLPGMLLDISWKEIGLYSVQEILLICTKISIVNHD